MGDDERIGFGLAAIRMLAEPDERWDAFVVEHGERSVDVVRFQLEALRDAIPEDSSYRSRYRSRLSELLAAIDAAPGAWTNIPEAVADAAAACRGPVPLTASGTPTDPAPPGEPPVGYFAPARAMAIGGARTDRYGFDDELWYDEDYGRIQRALDGLCDETIRIAFVVSPHGQLIGAAGDTENFDGLTRTARRAGRGPWPSGVAAKLLRDHEILMHFGEENETIVMIELVEKRLPLVVVFEARAGVGLVRLRVRQVERVLSSVLRLISTRVGAPVPEITEDDLRALLDDFDG